MTKRQLLIANLIRLNQKELAWHLAQPINENRDRRKTIVIQKLQKRLKINLDPKMTIEETLFYKKIVYPDGTKHLINYSWYE